MWTHLRPAVMMTILFTILTGVLYPLAMTGAAALIAPSQAEGSLIRMDGVIVGSKLIGQAFNSDRYFHSRPSATSAPDPQDSTKTVDAPYNAANSSGSNLGPTSSKLMERIKGDVEALRQSGPADPIPADAVTTSASGLDPHISPANANRQVPLVARTRNLSEVQVRDLVERAIERPWLGIFGEPRINVLALNLALDRSK